MSPRLPRRAPASTPPSAPTASEPDAELVAKRDRLIERFTVLQCDLGGLFYEMAIRDHVRMEVLTRRAAELQRIDAELGQVERLLHSEETGIVGHCPSCEAVQARAAVFCWQCGRPLVAAEPAGSTA